MIIEDFGQETYERIMRPDSKGSDADDDVALEKEMTAAMGEKGFSGEDGTPAQKERLGMSDSDRLLEMLEGLKNEPGARDSEEEEDETGTTAQKQDGEQEYRSPVSPEALPLGASSSWRSYEEDVKQFKDVDEGYTPPVDAVPADFGDPFEDERSAGASEDEGPDPIWLATLGDLLGALEGQIVGELATDINMETVVRGLCHDSSRVRPGDVFVCLRAATQGDRVGDGHDYAREAAANGAVAVVGQYRCRGLPEGVPQIFVSSPSASLGSLARALYQDPSRNLNVVAVTGTHGKSSVASLLHEFMYKTAEWSVPESDDGPLVRGGCGIVSSSEYSMFTSRVSKIFMTEDGKIWKAKQEDKTKTKRCTGTRSKPLWFPVWVKDTGGYTDNPETQIFTKPPITRYVGKYPRPSRSTPDMAKLQEIMGTMTRQGVQSVVLELSGDVLKPIDDGPADAAAKDTDSQGSFKYFDAEHVDVDIALFTNLSRDGLEGYPGTWEEYRASKARVFTELHDKQRQVAIINIDDPEADYFIRQASPVPVVTYALRNPKADVYLIGDATVKSDGTLLSIRTPVGDLQIKTKLLLRPMLSNLLATVCYALVRKMDLKTVQEVAQVLKSPPGRMDFVRPEPNQQFFAMVDRARTPAELGKLLDSVVDLSPKPKRIITVVGCPGDLPDAQKGLQRADRALIGRIAHEKSDIVFFTNDNPRREKPENIIRDIVAGLPPEVTDIFPFLDFDWLQDPLRLEDAKYGFPGCPQFEATLYFQSQVKRFVIEDRFDAIRLAVAMCEPGDTLVVAGKGDEDFQVLGDSHAWFDDRVEVTDAVQRFTSLKRKFVDFDANKRSKDYGKQFCSLDTSALPWRIVDKPGSLFHDANKPMNPYDNNYIRQYLERRGIPEWQWSKYWR